MFRVDAHDLAACDKDTNSPSESCRRQDLIQKRAKQPEKSSLSLLLLGGVTEMTVFL